MSTSASLHYFTCIECGNRNLRWHDSHALTVSMDCLDCGSDTEHHR